MELRLYPNLVTAATQRGNAGAIMFWTFCKGVDAGGQGFLPEETVKEAALRIWTPEKYYRYRREARDLGLVTPWGKENNKKHEDRLSWLGLKAACLKFDVMPGDQVILADSSCLTSVARFKAALFCAYQTARNSDNPISRSTLKELTTIGRKTQAVYEKRNNERKDGEVKAKPSFMLTGYSADHLRAAREEVHPACFVWGGEVVRPLPNTYTSTIRIASNSRLRKVKKSLRNLVNESGAGQCERLFFDGTEEEEAAKMVNKVENAGQPSGFTRARKALVKVQTSHKGCNVYKLIR